MISHTWAKNEFLNSRAATWHHIIGPKNPNSRATMWHHTLGPKNILF